MKPLFRINRYVAASWLILLGGYIAICEFLPGSESRIAANIFLCLLPVLVNGALLINAVSPDWQKRAFWMLLAFGCSLWMAGQTFWTYVALYEHRPVSSIFTGDVLFFLHTVPMIAALTVQPHRPSDSRRMPFGYVDFGVIVSWWLYLYVFAVIPWQYVAIDHRSYSQVHGFVTAFENIVFIAGAVMLFLQTTGYWRRIYAHLACAASVYTVRYVIHLMTITKGTYVRGALDDVPLIISFLWLGTAGIIAYQTRAEEQKSAAPTEGEAHSDDGSTGQGLWTSRMARAALFSLPFIGFWSIKLSHVPLAVREFRNLVTLGAVLPLGFLAFLRHELVDRERLRLLRASHESIDNLKRLQTQFVQSEKLASIGQLVAGAAHEINNPLTAILGYSELLADDTLIGEKARTVAEKIREQARRTKTLVNNLLSFARQVPSEQRTPLDINTIVNTSAQFRRFDLRGQNIRIEVQTGTGIPEVRADMNQLLQVFSNIINNAVYAMQEAGGGTLTVRTLFENGNVVILFSDTGPGMRDPHLVFDPFYTTKPVGKGTGLGLSICYGLIRDQGGQISCYNRLEGGATFRIELPAAPSAFLFSPRGMVSPTRSNPAKLA